MPFHRLRHTYATLSLQQGVDVRTISENLGHYDPAFTLSKYSGVTREMKQESTEKMGKAINGLFKKAIRAMIIAKN